MAYFIFIIFKLQNTADPLYFEFIEALYHDILEVSDEGKISVKVHYFLHGGLYKSSLR